MPFARARLIRALGFCGYEVVRNSPGEMSMIKINMRIAIVLLQLLGVVVLLLVTPTVLLAQQEFDYDSYKQTTLDEILDNPPKIEEGMDIFIKKRQFPVKLEHHLKPCRALIVGRVLRMQGVTETPEVSHCMQVSSAKGRSVQVFLQDALVDTLKAEVKQGDMIKVYAIYLYYSAPSKSHGILISGFKTIGSEVPKTKPNNSFNPSPR
jgi:hypothetical protein